MRALRTIGAACLLTAFAGCAHLGPPSVTVDRFDYSTTIAESWKEQTLLNIVKLRYLDLPVFVDVSSIVAGYSLQTGVSVNGVLSSRSAVQGDYGSFGGQGIYTDRPTITYVPLTGEKFLRGLVTPIDPRNIFFMIQSGYPADFVLGLTVESLNGVRNRWAAGTEARPADADFVEALHLIRELQAVGGIGMRVEGEEDRGPLAVVIIRRDDLPADVLEKAVRLRRLLRLAPDQQKFTLAYSPVRGTDQELAVNSRSMLQILQAFASYVEVPAEHLEAGVAMPAFEGTADQVVGRIRSGRDKPAHAFTAVRYRDRWFWVDDSDWQAKRALAAVIFFFTLMEGTGSERLPLVTIPAQ